MLIDNSLALINRTGAWHVARDLCAALSPSGAELRHWRLGPREPAGLARKLAARLMLAEIGLLGGRDALLIADRVADGDFRLFLDPLYVLRSRLAPGDIVLCHDIGPLSHPELYDPRTVEAYRLAYAKIARARPGIVFVSDWSRQRFEARFGTGFRFLRSIPLYLRADLAEGPRDPAPDLPPRFFLTVGALETRKNQVAALAAYRDGGFFRRGIGYVLCGPRGAGHAAITALARSIPGVVLPGYVPDARLRWLYATAEAFVLPSLLEGFGMPALEAACHGLQPIVTEASALVEAVGGRCLPVPANDPAAIAAAMAQALARSPEARDADARRLRELASQATRARFLAAWRRLLDEPAPARPGA